MRDFFSKNREPGRDCGGLWCAMLLFGCVRSPKGSGSASRRWSCSDDRHGCSLLARLATTWRVCPFFWTVFLQYKSTIHASR